MPCNGEKWNGPHLHGAAEHSSRASTLYTVAAIACFAEFAHTTPSMSFVVVHSMKIAKTANALFAVIGSFVNRTHARLQHGFCTHIPEHRLRPPPSSLPARLRSHGHDLPHSKCSFLPSWTVRPKLKRPPSVNALLLRTATHSVVPA